tara:strand:- start:234 stop:812 length:579 start_codon:yes stop_codon:yes gene_type:complete
MANIPDYKITKNPWGIEFYGPAGENDTQTEYTHHTKCGYDFVITNNGNQGSVVPGYSYEHILGNVQLDDRRASEKEAVAKLIHVENGDIVLTAENGNIRLKANNVWIEAQGSENKGSFVVNANEAVTIVAGEQAMLSGGKICLSSADTITLNAQGYIWLLADEVHKGGPFSNIPFLPSVLKDLLDGIALSCK